MHLHAAVSSPVWKPGKGKVSPELTALVNYEAAAGCGRCMGVALWVTFPLWGLLAAYGLRLWL
jgi:hypothetical protein